MRAVLSFLIRAYQLVVSPWLGSRCRFSPGCSEYALEALQKHGTWRGSWLALRRLSRCHPWHAGGHDPVPDVWPAASTGNPPPHSCRHHP